MNDEELKQALALFRESGHAWSEHWMNRQQAPAQPKRVPRYRLPIVLAASVAVAVLLLPHVPVQVLKTQSLADAPFVPIPFVAPPAPYERINITRMEVPVAALLAAGFDITAADPAGSVQADVLMGQDGRVHAVRLLERSSN